jgi:hypothetical protein
MAGEGKNSGRVACTIQPDVENYNVLDMASQCGMYHIMIGKLWNG